MAWLSALLGITLSFVVIQAARQSPSPSQYQQELPSNYNKANFTHKANLTVSVDGQIRGWLPIGLYGKESPKAVMNFLSQCETDTKQKNLENLLKLNITSLEEKFSFQNKEIYKIYHTELVFGDYFYNKTEQKKGNHTIFGSTYRSEVNEYETGLGALAQLRLEDNGHVGGEYTIFTQRASYDGPQSLWHVFGQVYENFDFLKYIVYTAGENNGIPTRTINIHSCNITHYSK